MSAGAYGLFEQADAGYGAKSGGRAGSFGVIQDIYWKAAKGGFESALLIFRFFYFLTKGRLKIIFQTAFFGLKSIHLIIFDADYKRIPLLRGYP